MRTGAVLRVGVVLALVGMLTWNVPTFAAAGVPESRPVVVSNVAHDGLPAMANVRVPPAASEALGWNE